MLFVDLILLRILMTGLLVGLLLAVFLLLRRLFPNLFSRRLRKGIWVALLLMSLLILPLPYVVSIPSTAPMWVFTARLPDPAKIIIDQSLVDHTLQEITKGSEFIQVDDNGNPIEIPAQELTFFPKLSLSDWVIKLLPYLRFVYLAGLVLTTVFYLLKWRKIRNEKNKIESAAIDRDGWLSEIASLRDQIGNYHQADVALSPITDPDLYSIYFNLRHHIIAVPTASPAKIPDEERRQFLVQMLKRNNHHALPIIVILLMIARCLAWFVPVWSLSVKALTQDCFSIRHQPPQKNRWFVRLAATVITAAILSVVALIIIWQIPYEIKPAYSVDQSNIKALQIETTPTLNSINLSFNLSNTISQDNFLVGEVNDDAILLSQYDYNGHVIWQIPSQTLLLMDEVKFLYVLNSRQFPDQSWSLILQSETIYEGSQDIWYIKIDQQGQVCERTVISSGYENEYYYDNFSLTDNGWICQKVYFPESGANNTIFHREIVRYSSDSQELWHDDLENLIDAKLESISKYYEHNDDSLYFQFSNDINISNIITTVDNNSYVVIQSIFNYSYSINSNLSNSYYYQNIGNFNALIFKLSPDGQLVWQKIIQSQHGIFFPRLAVCDDEGNIYLYGNVLNDSNIIYQSQDNPIEALEPIYLPSVCAISADGEYLWQHIFYDEKRANPKSIILQNNCLTFSFTEYPSMSTANPLERFIQMDINGQLIGQASIKSDYDHHYYFCVNNDMISIIPFELGSELQYGG